MMGDRVRESTRRCSGRFEPRRITHPDLNPLWSVCSARSLPLTGSNPRLPHPYAVELFAVMARAEKWAHRALPARADGEPGEAPIRRGATPQPVGPNPRYNRTDNRSFL